MFRFLCTDRALYMFVLWGHDDVYFRILRR